MAVGCEVGRRDGRQDGISVAFGTGCNVTGRKDGAILGVTIVVEDGFKLAEGFAVGINDTGMDVGRKLGLLMEGTVRLLGLNIGAIVGVLVGARDGRSPVILVGLLVGNIVTG